MLKRTQHNHVEVLIFLYFILLIHRYEPTHMIYLFIILLHYIYEYLLLRSVHPLLNSFLLFLTLSYILLILIFLLILIISINSQVILILFIFNIIKPSLSFNLVIILELLHSFFFIFK